MSLNFILETHSRARNTLGPYIGDVFVSETQAGNLENPEDA